jgi:signal peptidase I
VSILIFLIVSYLLLSFSLYLLFPKAGVDAVKGLIPGVNFVEWCKLIGQKPTHALWLLFPIVNIFIFAGMGVDLVRSFGKLGFKHSAAAVIYAPAAFYKIATNPHDKYVGPTLDREADYAKKLEDAKAAGDAYKLKQLEENNPYKKSVAREWVESIVFAVFAASFIRMFLIEAYVIPTPSMEGSLNVGDFLFVSKAHYGIRTPMTVAMIPLLHNQIPILNKESYLNSPSLPYKRLPALEKIEAGKPIVFNWPVGDSVYITSSRSYFVRQINPKNIELYQDRELVQKVKNGDFVVRPIDKKDHYIKRCVAAPGDSLRIINRQLYLNGVAVKNPKEIQFTYGVLLGPDASLNEKKLNEWNIHMSQGDIQGGPYQCLNLTKEEVVITKNFIPGLQLRDLSEICEIKKDTTAAKTLYFVASEISAQQFGSLGVPANDKYIFYIMILSEGQKKKVEGLSKSTKMFPIKKTDDPTSIFPNAPSITQNWTVDNYGPIWIPKAGATTPLSLENLPFYRRVIEVYEHNKLEVKGNDILINGQKATSYTFKQDYYWAMGDNRHNSEDSRAWGYVPHDHIVGKPLFIWFSTKEGSMRNGINWDRIFTSASKD